MDNTILVALGDLASAKSKITEKKTEAITHLLNYAATHPKKYICYHKNIMILHIHINVLYLSALKKHIHAGGHLFFSDNTLKTANYKHNGPIHIIAKILKNVIGSAAEAEIGPTYVNTLEP